MHLFIVSHKLIQNKIFFIIYMNKNNKKNNNYNSQLIKKIKNYINNSIHSDKFNHYKQKHSLDKLLDSLLIILLKGIPYRDIYKFTKIPWQNSKKSKIF